VPKSIELEILNLWRKYGDPKYTNDLMPIFHPPLNEGNILFVGLNPSFNPEGIKRFLNENVDYATFDVRTFYKETQPSDFDISNSIKIEEIAKNKYPYFKKFKEISKDIEMDWGHIDLFFIRETSQKDMKTKVLNKNETPNEFGEAQLKISKKIIEKSKPKVIVVANALASRIFEKYYNTKFNEETGHHTVELENNKNVPVFLASMLTGQRAMDNFSFKRLKWHIKTVIKSV